jgi:hypothetical protein
LLREGEKVQPSWLFQFLKNPYPIRPEKRMRLRMPRFNMSDDEAMALVNYFAAVDKTSNPSVGLSYPYLAVPQRDEGFLQAHTAQYVQRLQKDKVLAARKEQMVPIWKKVLPEETSPLEEKLTQAKQAVAKAQGDAKKTAEAEVARLQGELKALKDFVVQPKEWEKDKVYLTDAYRLVVNNNICLTCHQVGQWGKEPPMGPRLDQVGDRLRPEWVRRWVASPERLLIYPVGNEPMSKNFPKDKPQYQDIFLGTPLEQVTAVRDLLMVLPRAANFPENRFYRPPEGTGDAK